MQLFRHPMWYALVVALVFVRGWSPDHSVLPRVAAATQDVGANIDGVPPVRSSLQRIDVILDGLTSIELPAVASGRERAQTAVRSLLDLSAAWPATSPLAYRRSLAMLVGTLDWAAQRGRPALPQVLEALADDLEAKLEHCRASGGKLGGAVAVRVRTVQDGGAVRRWQVLYIPKILEVAPTAAPDLFPQLSSPTDDRLVPGRYLMWAREPFTGQTSERMVLKVGEGRAALDVELPVPPLPP